MNGSDIVPKISSSISLQINTGLLWIIFAVLAGIFGIVSAILLFHWKRYGMNNARIILSETVYLAGGGVFILIAVVSLLNL